MLLFTRLPKGSAQMKLFPTLRCKMESFDFINKNNDNGNDDDDDANNEDQQGYPQQAADACY